MLDIEILANGSNGNCYRMTAAGSSPLLLECGIPFKKIQQKLDFKTSSLSACLVSHIHKDHCKAVPALLKAGIDCYMSSDTIEALGLTGHRVHIVEALKQIQIGSWTILPFDAVHDVPCLGFLLCQQGYKVLFLTDTVYCKYRFTGLTHILLGCNYDANIINENVTNGTLAVELKNRIIHSHMSLQTALDFLRANDLSKVEKIYLLHGSEGNLDKKEAKVQIQKLTGKEVYVA
jgi:phosphoribosyl 1,2-cyclic phosphodiesterase